MSLGAHVGIKLGPLILGTLIQHFLRRETATKDSKAREELLYDEAFTIAKAFMEEATRHTIEELQGFSNTRIPSPPWVRTVRMMVPLSCCDEAADLLIEALGGIEVARNVAGGVRWWQVRGLEGIPAEWIMVRKDIDARRRQRKADKADLKRSKSTRTIRTQQRVEEAATTNHSHDDNEPEPHIYSTEMDGTPCMLYIHGGGGYFGSIDQERYMLHRHARKMSGRVFAINYRLAPQYPFPCALQDCLAAYLYLIRPPPGALHTPVDPALIIIAGDSHGGNLSLALLQVIRDASLPQPAGGVLISPWCDLTHSFPSCYTNMASDVIPMYGLNKHKPSTLWPPPAPMDTALLRDRISTRLQRVIGMVNGGEDNSDADTITFLDDHQKGTAMPQRATAWGDKVTLNKVPGSHTIVGNKSTATLAMHPPGGTSTAPVELKTTARCDDGSTVLMDGKAVTINSQIQFYATNRQLNHPYVSPILGYLGGLPPCLFIASDKECLRDEIIYTAHKAAHPETYLLKDETREYHPPMMGIEERYGPTDVHLQVYDETCHVLPMYSFTTPAKYCFRAIASFCKFVTKPEQKSRRATRLPPTPPSEGSQEDNPTVDQPSETFTIGARSSSAGNPSLRRSESSKKLAGRSILRRLSLNIVSPSRGLNAPAEMARRSSSVVMSNIVTEEPAPIEHRGSVADGRGDILPDGVETAGNPMVYACDEESTPFNDHMIRERISTRGVIRPLEPASEISACITPLEEVAVLNERSVRRYIDGQTAWGKKFSGVTKSIEKSREKNLRLARKEGVKTLDYLRIQLHKSQHRHSQSQDVRAESTSSEAAVGSGDVADEHDNVPLTDVCAKTVLGSRHWTWGWIMDNENPPPSSIASRRDTEEARRLSKVADRQIGEGDAEHNLSGNHLWSMIVESLAAHAGRNKDKDKNHGHSAGSSTPPSPPRSKDGPLSPLSRFFPFRHPKAEVSSARPMM
ncbi:hypothetical protein FRB94_004799 [Tulasnella sp. JGI-2019a]|nr:hypothetical protein FRB94_004799 [Tulasnella sp. JGI-2019a]